MNAGVNVAGPESHISQAVPTRPQVHNQQPLQLQHRQCRPHRHHRRNAHPTALLRSISQIVSTSTDRLKIEINYSTCCATFYVAAILMHSTAFLLLTTLSMVLVVQMKRLPWLWLAIQKRTSTEVPQAQVISGKNAMIQPQTSLSNAYRMALTQAG